MDARHSSQPEEEKLAEKQLSAETVHGSSSVKPLVAEENEIVIRGRCSVPATFTVSNQPWPRTPGTCERGLFTAPGPGSAKWGQQAPLEHKTRIW